MNLTIDIVGGNGLIGCSIKEIIKNATVRDWGINPNSYGYFNLLEEKSWKYFLENKPKYIILLSWPGLPNYIDDSHIKKNLIMYKKLIKRISKNNVNKVVIAGSCLEYGLVNGIKLENMPTNPTTNYGIAKDKLRIFIEKESKIKPFNWCWSRIFYTYSENSKRPTLYSTLIKAINNNEKSFKLGSGNQIRDFIHVKDVAKQLIELLLNDNANGIYNCASGKPITVKEFAKELVAQKNSKIKLEFGSYKDRDYEPESIWADMSKFEKINKNLFKNLIK